MFDDDKNIPESNNLNPETGLPEGWVIKFHEEKGREYFYNADTSKSTWNPPKTSNVKLIKSYMISHPFTIRVRHILLKHKHSRNPYRRITNSNGEKRKIRITLSEENAHKKMINIRDRIMAKKDLDERYDLFKKYAFEKSDCSSGKHSHGDLGICRIGKNVPEFEKEACSLQPGDISDVFKTSSGFHIVWRVK
ncbi:related to Peptidyl-prolyl cis-trans isomerase ESS1 [Hanseniaspora guilliermondii]|uniref:Peptidyl-prolyl cis-trans isomerase n=1 Tax=Hanseniaspora guilliermondii TaxID=56406 RepID=A0A1L0B010_9ASCO|nr:related to Peptidyl-prolyl cis-trans isomerase ESS1 [Hanseniaspora guilliermondii]